VRGYWPAPFSLPRSLLASSHAPSSQPNNDIYLSTLGALSVSGASGDGADVFVCHPTSIGVTTACTYGPGLYWDGSTKSFAGEIIDVVALSAASFGGALVQDINQIDDDAGVAGDDANPANPDDDELTEHIFLPIVTQ